MKLGGKTFSTPVKDVVLPREDGDIVFKICGITSFDHFDSLVKEPKPPTIKIKGKAAKTDRDDPRYQDELADYGKLKIAYIVVASLAVTPDLEWDQITLDNPSTWETWQKELADAGIAVYEINHLLSEILDINGLGEDRYKDAKDAFLANRVQTESK